MRIEFLRTAKLCHKEIVPYYNNVAWRYDITEPFRYLARKKAFSLLNGAYEQSPAHHVLDIGTGTGESAKYLSRISNNLVLVDPSKKMLRIANAKYSGAFNSAQMLIENLAFPRNFFDLVLISFVIHHLPCSASAHVRQK